MHEATVVESSRRTGARLRSRTGIVLAAVIALLTFGTALATPAQASSSAEAEFVRHINDLRASKGLHALVVDAELTRIGRNWAATMAAEGRIWHNPGFSSQVTANWRLLGENVGMGGSVSSLHQAFVNSPSHYSNLVHTEYTHIGVGVVVAADGTLFTAHQFMTLFPEAAPAATVSTTPAPASLPAAAPAPASLPAAAPAALTTTAPAAGAEAAAAANLDRVLSGLRRLDEIV